MQRAGVVILDGMRAHTVLRADREGKLNLDGHVGGDANYVAFLAEAIRQSHQATVSPSIRNAFASAGSYVGVRIQIEVVPHAKASFCALVLGSQDETPELLEALRKQHEA